MWLFIFRSATEKIDKMTINYLGQLFFFFRKIAVKKYMYVLLALFVYKSNGA